MQLSFHQAERVAVFIDGANLYSAARSLGFDIDYRRLLALLSGKGRLVRAFYYTALAEEQEYSPIRPLIDWLDYNGYMMVTKPMKEFTDSMGRRKVKGNMDIELAIDMMEMAPHIDHVVLFSGDGDFRRLVEAVQRKGLRVTVVSTIRSQPPMIADELRRQADVFVELQDLAPEIARARDPNREAQRDAQREAMQPDQGHEDGEDYEDGEEDNLGNVAMEDDAGYVEQRPYSDRGGYADRGGYGGGERVSYPNRGQGGRFRRG
ncbi:MAG: NYN domain-containing protein [Alphaproteobacteria bacterium]|nr:NYN domain-containing protein [Alphaproteobacteria bacterium]